MLGADNLLCISLRCSAYKLWCRNLSLCVFVFAFGSVRSSQPFVQIDPRPRQVNTFTFLISDFYLQNSRQHRWREKKETRTVFDSLPATCDKKRTNGPATQTIWIGCIWIEWKFKIKLENFRVRDNLLFLRSFLGESKIAELVNLGRVGAIRA